jgi:hypothetical protein
VDSHREHKFNEYHVMLFGNFFKDAIQFCLQLKAILPYADVLPVY